jgi:hypothetical protein
MPAAKPRFKAPAKPHSIEKLRKKITDDPEYGKFIHGEMRKLKKGDKKAKHTLRKHLRPTKKEAAAHSLSLAAVSLNDCTNPTTHNLIS